MFRAESDNDVRFHVARNILHLRRYRELSQKALAELMGTSQSAVARIEGGSENITLDTLQRLIDALRGRFHVVIQPAENSVSWSRRGWWEADVLNWQLIGFMTNEGTEDVQLLAAFRGQRGATTDRLTPAAIAATTFE